MNRRTFVLSGGALATISLSLTATSASDTDSVSFGGDFRAVQPDPEVSLDVTPRTPNSESTHTWELDHTVSEQAVESITLTYPDGTGLDGITAGDVDLRFAGSSPAVSSVSNTGSSATIQLDQPAFISGSATVTITDAVVNPAVGSYGPELVLTGATDERSFTAEMTISDGPAADQVYDIRRESYLEDREYIFEIVAGNVTNPVWEFGDGTTSTNYYVEHTYPEDGSYDLRLTVTIDGEEYAYTETVEVDTTPSQNGPPADDVYDIRQESYLDDREYILEIAGSANVADPRWEFGDGTTSTGYYNTHTYAEDGSYEVSLTVDVDGQDYIYYETLEVSASGSGSGSDPSTDGPPADQVYSISQEPWLGDREYIFQLDQGYDPSWDFGDSTTSTSYYVTHTYGSAGTYDITLDVTISGTQYTYTETFTVD